MIPFGEYVPDAPGNLSVLVGGSNVFARPNKTYGPVASFMAAFTALAQRCQGAFYSNDSGGNVALWAGTAGKLYKSSSGATFSDVSKSATTYACASNEFWEFTQFGQRVLATNVADAIQTYTLGSSSLFDNLLSSGAQPKARHMDVVANFLMLGNTNDGTYGAQTDGMWWSAIGDPTSFPTAGTSAAAAVQSGRVNIYGNGGWVQKIIPRVGTLDAVILQERAVFRCIYVGTPEVFAFQPMEGGIGTPSPGSVARFKGWFIYLGEDGFYLCDGTTSHPIGAGKVDKTFYQTVNQSLLYRIAAVIDPINKLYIVAYPSVSSGGDPDTLLMYSWAAQQWSPPTSVTTEFLTTLGSVGYTLEQLDAFGTLETLPASLDSRIWAGNGKPALAAFNSSHQLGFFTGSNMAAQLETGDADGQGRRFFVRGYRPIVSGATATVTAKLGYRETQNESVTYGSSTSLNRMKVAPMRKNTRHPRFVTDIAAASDWTHANGGEPLMDDAGGA
jgi:hypothetical protein